MVSKSNEISVRDPIVVVGNGMVGHRFCRALIERDPTRNLLVLGREPDCAYDRVNLGRMISETNQTLELDPRAWYENVGIDLQLGREVIRVDTENRAVICDDETAFPFSALIIATGSDPWKPPIEGIDTPGVLFYRTKQDVRAIREQARAGSHFAVIGGGLLGIEAAKALLDLDVNVTVLEIADHLMPRQLDQTGADLLQHLLAADGMNIQTGFETRSIRREGDKFALENGDADPLHVDGVIVSVGIRPCTAFLKESPIDQTPRGHIAVDAGCKTSVNGIFAIGECASVEGTTFGFVAPGYQMAEVLAERLTGGSRNFIPPPSDVRLKTAGIHVAVTGDHLQADPRSTTLVWQGNANGTENGNGSAPPHTYRKLILSRNRRLAGAISVGDWDSYPAVSEQIERKRRISKKLEQRFDQSGELDVLSTGPAVLGWENTAQVCNCMSVDKGRICASIAAGADSVEAIGKQCMAGTVCGSCHPLLIDLLDNPDARPRVPLSALLVIGASILCIIFVCVTLLAKPLLYAISVESYWYQVDQLWRDGTLKQFTGYSLFALCLLAMWLPIQKRFRALKTGRYAIWRAIHTLTGVLSLIILFLHTGFHFGANFNAWLLLVFAILNLSGGLVGVFTGFSARGGAIFTRLRPYVAWFHILCFWPIPILVLFHIFSVYYW